MSIYILESKSFVYSNIVCWFRISVVVMFNMFLCLGMRSDLASRNSSLHASNAQLQSENSEYKVSNYRTFCTTL